MRWFLRLTWTQTSSAEMIGKSLASRNDSGTAVTISSARAADSDCAAWHMHEETDRQTQKHNVKNKLHFTNHKSSWHIMYEAC